MLIPRQQNLWTITKTVSSVLLEAVFICGKLGELKPDLTTIAHLAIQLSYYAMSNLRHSLQARAGGLFVEGVGADIRRGGGRHGASAAAW